VRYQFIKEQAGRHRVVDLCRVLTVSKSGYYAFCCRKPSRREQTNTDLVARIRVAHAESDNTYGSPRVYKELRAQGVACSENRIARLMQREGIRVTPVRRVRVTTDSSHGLPVSPNRLKRDFAARVANAKWVSDITYLWTGEGWLYLAVVLDLFSRRVVGWSLAPSLHKEIVLDALEMAVKGRKPAEGLVHHSDRGSQYASLAFQERLLQVGAMGSMSGLGNCLDNAVAESFFATLKKELIHRERFETRKEARLSVFEWIEVEHKRSGTIANGDTPRWAMSVPWSLRSSTKSGEGRHQRLLKCLSTKTGEVHRASSPPCGRCGSCATIGS